MQTFRMSCQKCIKTIQNTPTDVPIVQTGKHRTVMGESVGLPETLEFGNGEEALGCILIIGTEPNQMPPIIKVPKR